MTDTIHQDNEDHVAARRSSRTLVVIPCAKTKVWDLPGRLVPKVVTVRSAYISQLFRQMVMYAEFMEADWTVLSAKHGFLRPDDVIEKYDVTFNNPGSGVAPSSLLRDQVERFGLGRYGQVLCLGGRLYLDRAAEAFGAKRIFTPFAGLPIGYLKKSLKKACEWRTMNIPMADIDREREALMPGTGIRRTAHHIGAFAAYDCKFSPATTSGGVRFAGYVLFHEFAGVPLRVFKTLDDCRRLAWLLSDCDAEWGFTEPTGFSQVPNVAKAQFFSALGVLPSRARAGADEDKVAQLIGWSLRRAFGGACPTASIPYPPGTSCFTAFIQAWLEDSGFLFSPS